MDKKALLKNAAKIAVAAALAGGSVAGTQFMAGDTVNLSAVIAAAVAAIVAYLKQSPLFKSL